MFFARFDDADGACPCGGGLEGLDGGQQLLEDGRAALNLNLLLRRLLLLLLLLLRNFLLATNHHVFHNDLFLYCLPRGDLQRHRVLRKRHLEHRKGLLLLLLLLLWNRKVES